MDRFFNRKVAVQSARILSMVLLIVHAWFIFYFGALGVWQMRDLNVISVLVYTCCFWIIRREKIDWFIGIVGTEVLVHMLISTYYIGIECGLQFTLLGMPIVFFYTDYFSLKLRARGAHGTVYSIIYMISYICIELFARYHAPIYQLPEWVNFYTRLSVLIMTFASAILLAYVMTRYAYTMEKNLRELAQTDALTGLMDRYGMQDYLRTEIREKHAVGRWILLLTLDNYEKIREIYGHVASDQALIEMANCLQKEMPNCRCARWDSNVFVLAGRNLQNEQNQELRLMDAMQKIHVKELMVDASLQISGGVATYEDGMELEQFIESAEQKLHLAKYNGGNQVVR